MILILLRYLAVAAGLLFAYLLLVYILLAFFFGADPTMPEDAEGERKYDNDFSD